MFIDKIEITFSPLPTVNITGGEKSTNYLAELYEYRNGQKEHIVDMHMTTNTYQYFFREWYGDYQFEIYIWDPINGLNKIMEHRYNDLNKNVLMNIDTNHLHEALIWFNCALEYKKLHHCNLLIKSNFNDILKEGHEDIQFVTEEKQDRLYAIYNIGKYDTEFEWNRRMTATIYSRVYNRNREYCSFRNPRDWHEISITDVANDILGINKI